MPVPTASPARTSLARLRTGPSTKPSSAPPLAGASRRSSSRVGRPLRGRGPTPLCLTLPACCDAPPPLRPGALALPAAARAQPPSPRYAFFRGLLSDACTLHAAWLFSLFHSVAVLHFVFVACDWLVASTLRVLCVRHSESSRVVQSTPVCCNQIKKVNLSKKLSFQLHCLLHTLAPRCVMAITHPVFLLHTV